MAGEHDDLTQTPRLHLLVQALGIALPARFDAAHDQAAHRQAMGTQLAHQFNEILVTLESAQPARQGQQRCATQLRVVLFPGRAPLGRGCIAMGECSRIDTTRDHHDALGRQARIMLVQVVAHRLRHGNHPLAPGHDRAIGGHRVQAMHGRDKAWPAGRIEAAPSQPGDPGRQARADVQDVDALFGQPAAQRANPAQGQRRLRAQWPA